MSILDPYGNPARSTYKFVHGADTSRYRGPQFLIQNKSLEDLISERDRDVIVSLSKRLFTNLGALKAVVNQRASYSVGLGWGPRYMGPDKEQGERVKSWLTKTFFPLCDVRRGQWDWWANLESISTEIDVCGDAFTLLTTTPDGLFPQIQNIPAHMIRTKGDIKDCMVSGGPYSGAKIVDGIIYTRKGRPLAYRMSTGQGVNDYEDLPAASVIHSFDPWLSDGKRGLPVATHALEDLKHILQSTEYERTRQMILSSIGLLVENDIGGPDPNDPASLFGQPGSGSTTNGVNAKEINPSIFYMQAGAGEKISQLKHEAGGDTFESFQDRMLRSFVTGCEWSYSFVWKPTGQGTAERADVLRVRKSIARRQKRLEKWAMRVVTYAYSMGVQNFGLPELNNPFSWEFTKPARPSVDDGREAQMLREDYKMGSKNLSDILEAEGKTYQEHIDERIAEIVYRKKAAQAAQSANQGIVIDDRELVMLTPNETASSQNSNSAES